MAVGGAGRTTGVAALLVALGIVLAAGALPALAGQTPLDRFTAGDDAGSTASGERQPQSPGELNEDVAGAAEEAGMGDSARSLARVLSTLVGDGSVSGAAGGAASTGDPPQDGEPTAATTADGSDGATADGTGVDGSDQTGNAGADGSSGETDSDGTSGSDSGTESSDSQTDGLSSDGTASDGTTADGGATTNDGTTASDTDGTTEAGGDRSDSGDDAATTAAGQSEEAAADDDSPPEPEGVTDSGAVGTAGLVAAAILLVLLAVLAIRSDRRVTALVRSLPTLLAGAVSRFVFGIADVIERALAALRSVSTVGELRRVLFAAATETKRSVGRSVRSLLGGEPTPTATDTSASLTSDREQIRAAWRTVVDTAGVSRPSTRTPGEIKQQAVDAGLPEEPLATLLGTFRAVEYGDREPGDRAAAATDAARQVETAATTLSDETADTDTDHNAPTDNRDATATGEDGR